MAKIIYIDKKLNYLPVENNEGNREYKLILNNSNKLKLEKLTTQIKYRLYEGKGKALYLIGVKDDGEPIGINDIQLYNSLKIIMNLTKKINAHINIIRIYKGNNGNIATIRINKIINDEFYDL